MHRSRTWRPRRTGPILYVAGQFTDDQRVEPLPRRCVQRGDRGTADRVPPDDQCRCWRPSRRAAAHSSSAAPSPARMASLAPTSPRSGPRTRATLPFIAAPRRRVDSGAHSIAPTAAPSSSAEPSPAMNGTARIRPGAAWTPPPGASLPLPVNTLVRNGGANAAILSLESDGQNFYGTGFTYGGGGNFEGTFAAVLVDWRTSRGWRTATATPTRPTRSVTSSTQPSHKHFCGNIGGFPQTTPWSVPPGHGTVQGRARHHHP